jgi:polyhydroxyalkanoate synthesis regulator phasin
MRDAIKRYVDAAQSLTEIPRERAERVARRLAGNGMIDPGQIRSVAVDLVERSRENSRRVTELVAGEIRRQLSRVGFASRDEVEHLRRRVQALEANQAASRRASAKAPTSKRSAPARKAAAPKRRATVAKRSAPARSTRSRPRRRPSSAR